MVGLRAHSLPQWVGWVRHQRFSSNNDLSAIGILAIEGVPAAWAAVGTVRLAGHHPCEGRGDDRDPMRGIHEQGHQS